MLPLLKVCGAHSVCHQVRPIIIILIIIIIIIIIILLLLFLLIILFIAALFLHNFQVF